jgi:hypothetical protein
VRRRRLTAQGVQPSGAVQQVFEGFYVDGAVAPTTGARFFLELPSLNAASGQRFIDAFAEAFSDSFNPLLLENSGAPTAQRLTIPANGRFVFLPPDGPERNPSARGWRDRTDDLAWPQFLKGDAPQDEGDQ